MKKNCAVDIKIIIDYIGKKIAKDKKFKDFSNLAKFLIDKPGEPDDIKVAVVTSVAKVFKVLNSKDDSYKLDSRINFLLSQKLQDADLKELFSKIKKLYSPSAPSSIDGIDELSKKLANAGDKEDYEIISFIDTDIIKNLKNIINRLSPGSLAVMRIKAIALLDNAKTYVEKNTKIAERVKKSAIDSIDKCKTYISNLTQYVPLSTTRYQDAYDVFDEKGKLVDTVFRDLTSGKYYSFSDTTKEVVMDDKIKLSKKYYDKIAPTYAVSRDGAHKILSYEQISSGTSLAFLTKDSAIEKALLSLSDPNNYFQIKVTRTSARIAKNRVEKLKEAIPGRTLETFESLQQQKYLERTGNPIAAVSTPIDGVNIQMFIPGIANNEFAMVYDLSNMAAIHANNKTELIDFTNSPDFSLIKSLFKKQDKLGNPVDLSDADVITIIQTQKRIAKFKEEAIKMMDDQNVDEVVVPKELYQNLFSLRRTNTTPSFVKKEADGALLDEAIDNPNVKKHMIDVKVVTVNEDGDAVTQAVDKKIPILIHKVKGEWKFSTGTLDAFERVVDGKDLITTDEYFQKYHPNALKVKENITGFPNHIGYALVLYNNFTKQYHFVGANKEYGADPIKNTLRYASAIQALKEKILKNPTNINSILKEFNRFQFTISPYKGWYADLSGFYDEKKKDVNFHIEIRPGNDKTFSSEGITDEQRSKLKAATKLFFDQSTYDKFIKMFETLLKRPAFEQFIAVSSKGVYKLNDLVKDGEYNPALFDFMFKYLSGKDEEKELLDLYDKLTEDISNGFEKVQQKLVDLNYTSLPDLHILLENENSDFTGRNFLKINDNTVGFNLNNLDQFRLTTDANVLRYSSVKMDTPGAASSTVSYVSEKESVKPTLTEEQKEEKPGGSKPQQTNNIQDDNDVEESEDDDYTFSLVDAEETVIPYDNESYKSELDWIEKNLPSDFNVADLANILSKIKADGRVLGYFKDLTIYMNKELSGKGTGYHEAFHGVFRRLLSTQDRRFYISKAMNAMGTNAFTKEKIAEFRNKRRIFNLSDNQVMARMAEEFLADKFKEYKLNKVEPKQSWLAKLVRLFEKVVNFFTGNSDKIDDITKLFDRIDTGYYKNAGISEIGEYTEGAAELLSARPAIDSVTTEGKLSSKKRYFNSTDQKQLINRLVWEVNNTPGVSFDQKFQTAVEKLLVEYDVENLIASNPTLDAQKIRNKYTDQFADIRYALGDANSLYDNLTGDTANDRKISEDKVKETHASLKEQVRYAASKINIKSFMIDTDAMLDEKDDEDKQMERYDDTFGTLNPMDGLSRQFRRMFNTLPYSYEDKETGVTLTRMLNGDKVFNVFMKISADQPFENILETIKSDIDSLKEDGDLESYNLLNSAYGFLSDVVFGLDENYKPTRNFNLYNQFMNTFFVTEVPTYIYKVNTKEGSSYNETYDASIQRDITNEVEKQKVGYNQKFFKLPVEEKKRIFEEARNIILEEVVSQDDLRTNESKTLNKKAKAVKEALHMLGFNFSTSLIKFSLVNIDRVNNNKEFAPTSQAAKLLKLNPVLADEGAYLQEDFFTWVIGRTLGPEVNIFEKTDYDILSSEDLEELDKQQVERTPAQNTQINGIMNILKKASKYMIKHDVSAPLSVFQNAEGKNVYRYVKYTPILLMGQKVKQSGLQGLVEDYPMFEDWFKDNPLYNKGKKNKELALYLSNFNIGVLGGTRQRIGDKEKEGATFKHIDPRSKHIADIAMFADKKRIRNGKTEIITYQRSFSISEGSSTNYMIPALYQTMYTNAAGFTIDEKTGKPLVVSTMIDQIRQEYNRIQREWATREERKKLGHRDNYTEYNARIVTNKETKEKTVDTESASLRAYNFNRLSKFFGKNEAKLTTYVHPDADVAATRGKLRDDLILMAKAGVPFEKITSSKEESDLYENLKNELMYYVGEEFQEFENSLIKYGVVEPVVDEEKQKEIGPYTSSLISGTLKTGVDRTSLEDAGYKTLRDYMLDYFLNDYNSRLFTNQIFDGDLAVNVKNATNYAMRNKYTIIAGDSMREGFHTVAYVDKITILMDPNNLEKGQYDSLEDVPEEYRNDDGSWVNDWKPVDVFDGQSVTTLEHRMDMYEKQGRLEDAIDVDDSDMVLNIRSILEKARIEPLTKEEIKFLEKAKVVLGSYKTATGGMIEFIKQSEHIILRTDVSYIKPLGTDTIEQTKKSLRAFYNEVDVIRQHLKNGDEFIILPEYGKTPREVLKEIYESIHSVFEPLPGREIMHHILNSMEMHGVDQMVDLNASKKGTPLSIELNRSGYTDFSLVSRPVANKFKYMQVETSGVSKEITVPTQKQQLIDTDILLTDPKVPEEVKNAINNYRESLHTIANLSVEQVKLILDAPDNEVNIAPILKTMRLGLEKQGADANVLKIFETDEEGKPTHNINLPVFKQLFQNYFFSFYSNNVFSQSSAGRKDFEVTSLGYKMVIDQNDVIVKSDEVKKDPEKYKNYRTRYPGVIKEVDKEGNIKYVVEVIIPKPMFKNKQHEELFLARLAEMISTRIPTEDKRSMVVARVVDYVDSAYQNIIILPQLVHVLAGSDLDIDALYSQTLATYEGLDGKTHVYGEYETYDSISVEKARFAEYLINKSTDGMLKGEVEEEFNKIINAEGDSLEIPDAIEQVYKELGLERFLISKENIRTRLAELRAERKSYYQYYLSLKEERGKAFDKYVKIRAENEEMMKEMERQAIEALKEAGEEYDENSLEFKEMISEVVEDRIHSMRMAGETDHIPNWKKQGNYSRALRDAKDRARLGFTNLTGLHGDFAEAKEIYRNVDTVFRVIATLNVLAKYELPTNVSDFRDARNIHIIEVAQNSNVKAQMKILSSYHVYNSLYINEKSSTKYFDDLIKSQDNSIDNVVDKYDMNSPAWVANMVNLNSAGDLGIGVAATNNKVFSFLSKYGIKLKTPVWEINGIKHTTFESLSKAVDEDGIPYRIIAEIGRAIGMFADAKKEPYPSILNLDQDTASVALSIIQQGIHPDAAYNLNLIPLIQKAIIQKQSSASSTITEEEIWKSSNFESVAKNIYGNAVKDLFKKEEDEKGVNRFDEYYQTKDNGKVKYDKNGNPMIRAISLSFNYDKKNASKRESAADYGFTATYKDNGDAVADDIVQIHLLSSYINQIDMMRDNFHLNRIINLIKKQKPSFEDFDRLVHSYAYLIGLGATETNYVGIKEVLKDPNNIYYPLIQGVMHFYKTSEKVFLERNPVFSQLNNELIGSMSTYQMTDKYKGVVNTHVVRYLIANRMRVKVNDDLQKELAKPKPNQFVVKVLTDAQSMFTSDFWEGKATEVTPTMTEEVNYLYDNHSGNAFVDFIRHRTLDGLTFVEALSRMKLDTDITDDIIDGYNLLRQSLDPRTKAIASKLFTYLVVKDNLGFSNNSFLRYLSPDMYEGVSKDLNTLQKALNQAASSKEGRKKLVKGEVFREFLMDAKLDLPIVTANMLYKAVSNVSNKEFLKKTRKFKFGDKKTAIGRIKNQETLKMFLAEILPNLDLDWRDVYKKEKTEANENTKDLLVPTSSEMDKGEVIVNLSSVSPMEGDEIQERIFRMLGITIEYEPDVTGIPKFVGYTFPMALVNSEGQLLRLDTIDGKSIGELVGEKISDRLMGKSVFNSPISAGRVTGKTARYVVSGFEGTYQISNNAFTTDDARSINNFIEKTENYSNLTITEDFKKFLINIISKYGIDADTLERLRRWIKNDVDKKGRIIFGKKGAYTIKYKARISENEPMLDYIIELSPSSDKDDLSVKAAHYVISAGAKIELYSRDIKAVEYHKLTKAERIQARQEQLLKDNEPNIAKALGITVDEYRAMREKGQSLVQTAPKSPVISDAKQIGTLSPTNQPRAFQDVKGKFSPKVFENLTTDEAMLYARAIQRIDESKNDTELNNFLTKEMMDYEKYPYIRTLPQEVFTYLFDEYAINRGRNFGEKQELIEEKEFKEGSKIQGKTQYYYGKSAKNSFEVSSAAPKGTLGQNFSALFAKLSDGRSIEEAYQLDVKGHRQDLYKWLAEGNKIYKYKDKEYDMTNPKNHWIFGKGKPPIYELSKTESYIQYRNLWIQFAIKEPGLIRQLMVAANGKTLTDKFSTGDITQARALADIMNAIINNPSFLDEQTGGFDSVNQKSITDALQKLDAGCKK